MAIKHTFTSSKPDGVDATLVQPSNWNQNHVIEDGTITAQMLVAGVLDGRYVHVQGSPAIEWIVNHNLGFKPIIEFSSTGGIVGITDVVHFSVNQARLYFAAATAGEARCV